MLVGSLPYFDGCGTYTHSGDFSYFDSYDTLLYENNV
jgi:hypothetical protein